eukprot:TRINITY_DN7986_c0_g1_i1.p2 TRINITY_DN7986_c0_g1~~TRINITY_DN7986_c0_g1_i1.p2  ORF type:complete len:160 (-),score=29.79 TRINITY_DN7986_c0_g1_i1:515-940(-)
MFDGMRGRERQPLLPVKHQHVHDPQGVGQKGWWRRASSVLGWPDPEQADATSTPWPDVASGRGFSNVYDPNASAAQPVVADLEQFAEAMRLLGEATQALESTVTDAADRQEVAALLRDWATLLHQEFIEAKRRRDAQRALA